MNILNKTINDFSLSMARQIDKDVMFVLKRGSMIKTKDKRTFLRKTFDQFTSWLKYKRIELGERIAGETFSPDDF